MSIKKFKFVSPGVFINEIDNSHLPATFDKVGPLVIGRTERGPALRPVRVDSFSEFINIFGNPIPGGQGGDVWRDGNYTSPTYAAYAVQAWLKNNGPCTIVRLLGAQDPDATSTGKAGWKLDNDLGTADSNGGAYGLFIIPSASTWAALPFMTGTLAAVWHMNVGSVTLSGALRTAGTAIDGTAVLIDSTNSPTSPTDVEFRVAIKNSSGTTTEKTIFNFNRTSQKYIRKVFNTNPTLTNTKVTSTTNKKDYFLGETYERALADLAKKNTLAATQTYHGVILGLEGSDAGTSTEWHHNDFDTQAAQSGWVFSQDLTDNYATYQANDMQKLFRFIGLDTGEWDQKNLKISIQDITAPTNQDDPHGTFSVVVRKADDHDNAIKIVERFSNCNLNPNSANYIARKIGDRYLSWDSGEKRHRVYGNYSNASKFIRVEIDKDVDAGAVKSAFLPFGFYGPPRFNGFIITSGGIALGGGAGGLGTIKSLSGSHLVTTQAFVKGSGSIANVYTATVQPKTFVNTGTEAFFSGAFLFPEIPLRVSSSDGDISSPKEAYFGIDTTRNGTNRFEDSYTDLVRVRPGGESTISSWDTGNFTSYSFIMSLDDLSGSGTVTSAGLFPKANWVSGSRKNHTSISSQGTNRWKVTLDSGFDRFTIPLHGGHDGLDVTEKDPFNNRYMDSDANTRNNYAYNTVKRAIDTVKDAEVVEFNLASVPGLRNWSLNEHLISVCEARGDSLALIDLEGDYKPAEEGSTSGPEAFSVRAGSVDTTITNLLARGINSSYGAAYYPWVQIRDDINNSLVWAPPSVAALGVFGSAETSSELWFAPAGFTRGGLSDGAAGLPVVSVSQRLTSKERDRLYEANVNPIATFPAEGIVIFGQKTLQVTPSALDRVNVRRLLIFVKKEISRMAATTLFQQNVQSTWNSFLGKVDPFLRSVQIRLGLGAFKVILDETTTTSDLVDRNIMYAKIFLKPVQAIEFIALDFVITDSGASFED